MQTLFTVPAQYMQLKVKTKVRILGFRVWKIKETENWTVYINICLIAHRVNMCWNMAALPDAELGNSPPRKLETMYRFSLS